MFVIDGLPAGIEQRLPLPSLEALKAEGVWYQEVYLPLAAHPAQSNSYPWTCSLPNPVLMSGTVFVGQDGVAQHLIQHSFTDRPTAFFVNAWTYAAISDGFAVYADCSEGKRERLFQDELPVKAAKKAILDTDPAFLRIHCQGPGSAGHRSHREQGQSYTGNIWAEDSPFRSQNLYVDALLGDFVRWLKAGGFWETTVLLVMGDHGQCHGGGHDPFAPGLHNTQLVVAGAAVKKGVSYPYADIVDVAPTIAWLQNVPVPGFSIGRALKEIRCGEPEPKAGRSLLKDINETLLAHHAAAGNGAATEFFTIEDIGRWHTTEAGTDLQKFAARQKALLQPL